MKKIILTVALIGLMSSPAQAGWFGAKFGETSSVTLFGQTLQVSVPSVTLGSAAGTKVSASADSSSASVSLPFIKIGAKTPKLTVGAGADKVSLSTAGVKSAKAKIDPRRAARIKAAKSGQKPGAKKRAGSKKK